MGRGETAHHFVGNRLFFIRPQMRLLSNGFPEYVTVGDCTDRKSDLIAANEIFRHSAFFLHAKNISIDGYEAHKIKRFDVGVCFALSLSGGGVSWAVTGS